LPPEADLLCVGHNPYLPMVVQELGGAQVSMKPGGLARLKLEADGRHGILEWLITPRVFDALDRAG
ncbi:MAG: hypothetical protein OXB89_08415, partial [Anaerolineaceae bacterium]|nr:hypothetical protein [Anaerolineaceae bacterium]